MKKLKYNNVTGVGYWVSNICFYPRCDEYIYVCITKVMAKNVYMYKEQRPAEKE